MIGDTTMKKIMKQTLLLTILTIVSLLSATTVHAENTAAEGRKVRVATISDLRVGDSVYICKDSLYYLTGERISKWVYKVPHVIRQVGGRTRPNGVLIGGINSWVYPAVVQPVHPRYPVWVEDEPAAVDTTATVGEPAVQPAPADTVPAEQPVVEQPEDQPLPADTVAAPAQEKKTSGEVGNVPVSSDKTIGMEYKIPQVQQFNRFTMALRGGVASTLPKGTNITNHWGFDALLDLQYSHYWVPAKGKCNYGILTGLSLGYMQNTASMSLNNAFTAETDGGNIDYTITASLRETDRQLQLEVPLMFAFLMDNGFYLNVGPRLMLPVYTPFTQTVTDPTIEAYFPREDVSVVNKPVTGVVTDAQCSRRGTTDNQFRLNLLLGLELGYELSLQSGRSVGFGVYANYGVYSMYSPSAASQDAIRITPPSNAAPLATVEVLPMAGSAFSKLGYFDAGIKLSYHFNFWK